MNLESYGLSLKLFLRAHRWKTTGLVPWSLCGLTQILIFSLSSLMHGLLYFLCQISLLVVLKSCRQWELLLLWQEGSRTQRSTLTQRVATSRNVNPLHRSPRLTDCTILRPRFWSIKRWRSRFHFGVHKVEGWLLEDDKEHQPI